ncbi:hypothetical protein SUGI_0701070 [Cryptomeria japonica]|uniref:putative UPF0481 protein At3g02645 n=1 Tax=Cryptomeria japonica TaxID=3369 RepID=UPI0024148494|nr:putative UPF0481 protein At3g02645 [Cryptomeria japonica]GLJ34812.1 hypothetical protein SUGI_0701070 [Cryptomeria japonica]
MNIGSYHQRQKDRQIYAIDNYKLEAVQRTTERIRIRHENDNYTIYQLIAEVRKIDEKIRNCYEDSANEYSEEALSWMFTMDACFILEFFRTSVAEPPKEEDNTKVAEEEEHAKEQERFSLLFEYNGRQNIFRYEIMRDIIKLENQIPLFVLRKILELHHKNEDDAVSEFVELLLHLQEFTGFPFSLSSSDDKMKKETIDPKIRSSLQKHIKEASHLLDFSRRVIKDILTDSTSPRTATDNLKSPSSNSSDGESTPSARKLHEAGIIFKPGTAGEVKFEGRHFRSSTFCIPEITIDDDTEIFLRNLIALEECQGSRMSPEPTIISNYIHLMDDLIDTSEDVGVLKKGKVIKSLVGSDEEIATTINDLCKGITDNPYPHTRK